MTKADTKPLEWIGSSKKDLREFPENVRMKMGFALYEAQRGDKPDNAKPLKGFHGASVLEIVEDYDLDTYRAMYTVRFAGIVYVLHVFQKKSKHGIATPQRELDLVKQRLREAEQHYQDWLLRQAKPPEKG